jgi:membrane protein YfhO
MRRATAGHGAALGAIAALAFLLFPRAVFRGEAFYERDVQLVWHSQVEAFVRSIHAGSWPVWNPFLSFGQPMLANPHTQVLYPFTWLNLILPPWALYTVFVVAHTAFAGAGLYLLARFVGLSRGGGVMAAVCWMASGPFLSLANMWIQMAGASWIPWVLLAAGRALASRRTGPAVLWGAAVAMQLFAGSPDMSIMTAAASAAWALASIRPIEKGGPPQLRVLAAAAVACAFAVALSAALWLPALELTRHAARWSMESAQRAVWSVDPLGLAEVLSPVPLTDLPISAGLRNRLYDGGLPLMHALYLGLPALALVAAALAGAASRTRTAAAWGLAAAVVFSLGRHTPLYEIAVALVPPLRVLRFPSKAMVLAAFAWALLAGIGFDRWRSAGTAAGRRWLATVVAPLVALAVAAGALAALLRWQPGVFARALASGPALQAQPADLASASLAFAATAALATVAAAAAVARWRRPSAAPALAATAAVASVLDLVLAGFAVNGTVPVEFFRFRPPILDAVKQADLSRLFVYRYPLLGVAEEPGAAADDPYRLARYPPGMSREAGRALAARLYLMPPVGGCWDLFGSYEPDLIGLDPPHVVQLVRWMQQSEGTPDYARFLRLGAVGHVSSLRRHGGFEDLSALAVYPSLLARPILLFEVPGALPRSYVVGTARAADGDAARRVLLDPGFDIRREVVLPDASFAAGPGFSGTSRVLDMRPDRVRVQVELSEPGVLVLVDTYDPGWKATVDGRPQPLLRANVAFRGVRVPAGSHVVEQVYRPGTVVYGLWTSAAAALAGLAVVLASRRRGAEPEP